jgi:hypothetical protein
MVVPTATTTKPSPVDKSLSLTMSAGVKQNLRTLLHALIEERHFVS